MFIVEGKMRPGPKGHLSDYKNCMHRRLIRPLERCLYFIKVRMKSQSPFYPSQRRKGFSLSFPDRRVRQLL